MFLKCIEVGDVVTNCYVFGKKEVVIIDPGDDATKIENIIVENDLIPRAILLTHGHFDHFLGCSYLKQRFKLPIYAHRVEKEILSNPAYNLSYLIGSEVKINCDGYFEDGDVLEFADFSLKVLHTPGHTPGSSCFLYDNILFSGDTLFKDSFGRCDLPLGDERQIFESIKEKLLVLPRNTKVYPGHGVPTTIGDELKNF
ncbi:glyoxylase-like metal-dependent hydrolase (beta-lactamase superfamily II) [Caldicellulosiruptor bescii]|jgi:glyoxylase-like metal-dependent hydrolase (beta-lactamase superfamily II)|uniref:Beta-lactamase domain protein n=2 Tax=Caldicellulosiruptor bescii TaxID=31899 RepID=B9ML28_CALBD|nr:MBL fold metallo-hydrolase [Caldicellulosiruptor bescii]ACM61036.1 beta-lactamase domain protein [Caldicellulosiruptor bescii DSM 6725]PBC89150.1 glyoxylase-like metal-dependent hydrolase (beta-lactamase superfamily II) [Caldicellulosiruptor bescii]PBC91368.1 glyoxylase-like metal-dependent hydrolase (beta-lactamase superfamily II) [Caldicellulosiruptor bescii]PBD03221.1 glyoxylase-like metal-dependent hydrolase (beta-lactamase superfamily II) [Caldicellulosiruptor bescii]PBD07166.1 glyoxyl